MEGCGSGWAGDWRFDIASSPEEDEEDLLADMGGRITAPYRSDRELLHDCVVLMDLRAQLFTLRVRAREWEEEGFFERDGEHERGTELEIARVQRRVDRLAERIEAKRDLARRESRRYALDEFSVAYGLSQLELNMLLILLLEDITVSGQKTYSRGRELLGILVEDRLDVLEFRKLLYPTAPLSRHGLVTSSLAAEATVLDAYFKISERAVQELTHPSGDGPAVARQRDYPSACLRQPAEPRRTLADVVLPPDVAEQVGHVVDFVANRELILDEWGFGEVHGHNGQSTVLFHGPPGTGKTLTAEAVAHELGRKLLLVSYPELVSKWVGDTEKNIASLFATARETGAVLVFDEADAMFHARVEVATATDQSFNREVNVLLQEVERFEGVLILTTNRAHGLDRALERRIGLRIEFPQPDTAARREIWRRHLPERAPLAPDVDLDEIAREFQLSGGNIRNAALRAAVAASKRGNGTKHIAQADLRAAAEQELVTLDGSRRARRMGLVPAGV